MQSDAPVFTSPQQSVRHKTELEWSCTPRTTSTKPHSKRFTRRRKSSNGAAAIGEQLEWQELPGKKAMRIVVFKHGVDPADEAQYPAIQAWMLAKLERFRDVFGPRVKALSLPSWSGTGNVDGPDQ